VNPNRKLVLKVIKQIQNQPTPIDAIARRVGLCVRTTNHHLGQLEQAKLIEVDRSARPHAYELTTVGYVALQFEEDRDRRLFFHYTGEPERRPGSQRSTTYLPRAAGPTRQPNEPI
jgi:predicted transcriptional regulator